MRIGILTLPLHTNYGGILQAYALQTVLERMGHDVKVINRNINYKLSLWKTPFVYSKRIIKNILGYKTPIFYEQKLIKEQPIIRQNTDRFIRQYIHMLNVDNYTDLRKEDFDAIVVGSDQVWRPDYNDQILNSYLKFASSWNIRRIAYAPSFGTSDWGYRKRQTILCRQLIHQFNAVSVREDTGIDLCCTYFNVIAKQVLDPTMLLDKEDYIQLCHNSNTPKSDGTLLTYILDETNEKLTFIKEIAKEKKLIPFRVNSMVENPNAPLDKCIQPPVEQWLRGFYDAEFIVTDSFHACVFAILFHKPFVVFGNEDRGMSRFTSLLNLFGLNDCLIIDASKYVLKNVIDWEDVDFRLKRMRVNSIEFLQSSLK